MQNLIAIIVVVAALGGAAWFGKDIMDGASKEGFVPEVKAQTVMFIDLSRPHFSDPQKRDTETIFSELFPKLSLNEKLSIFTSAQGTVSSLSRPFAEFLKPPQTQADLQALGLPEQAPAYLLKESGKAREAIIATGKEVLDDKYVQSLESPIYEFLMRFSRMWYNLPLEKKRIVLISDGLQFSENFHHRIRTPNDNTFDFEQFKASSAFYKNNMLKLQGVRITWYLLDRNAINFKTADIRQFWSELLQDCGAQDIEFVVLRQGFE